MTLDDAQNKLFCASSKAGIYNLLLLSAVLILFIWSTAANEFELYIYIWDTFTFLSGISL